jgi:hypothetical protein
MSVVLSSSGSFQFRFFPTSGKLSIGVKVPAMDPRSIVLEGFKRPVRSVLGAFWMLDKHLGYPVFGIRENRRTRDRWTDFMRDVEARRQRYRDVVFPIIEHHEVLERINSDGFAVIRNALPVAPLLEVKRELEECLETGAHLKLVANDTVRRKGDFEPATVFLTPGELAKGQTYFRSLTNFAAVDQPLCACPASVAIAFDDLLFDIAAGYLACVPAVGGCNLRKSFVNDITEFDTLYFHADPNSPKFLKFFCYLNDVDVRGGPFCYVRGSHRDKFRGWCSKYRWTHDEIAAIYGESRIMNLTANVGDLIVADTNGFHRGTKVQSADRSMLTIDYVIHTEFDGKQPPFKMHARDYAALSPKQRTATDLLEIVT